MCNLSERIFERGFEQGFKKGFEQGFKQGYEQTQARVIIRMYENGASIKQIFELVDMSEEQVKMWIVEKEKV